MACLLTQPGNVVMGQADGRQRVSDHQAYLAAVDRGSPGGQMRRVPSMATGRTGTWLVTAMTRRRL